jgi:hypothetical protein
MSCGQSSCGQSRFDRHGVPRLSLSFFAPENRLVELGRLLRTIFGDKPAMPRLIPLAARIPRGRPR